MKKTSKKDPSSNYHHGDLRNALVRAGVEILSREGAQKLSLREAARNAGVSQAAPYRHFQNKEALLAAIAQEGFTLLESRVRSVAESYRGRLSEQLYQVALSYLKLSMEHGDHFNLMFCSVPCLHPEKHTELKLSAQKLFEELVRVIERCQEARVVRAGDSKLLALIAWSSFHGLTSLVVSHHLSFLDLHSKQIEQVLQDLMRSLSAT